MFLKINGLIGWLFDWLINWLLQAQEKSRELSMLTVDNRQLQYRLDKLEADYRQESEKVRLNKFILNFSIIIFFIKFRTTETLNLYSSKVFKILNW